MIILQTIILFLPAGFANMTPPLLKKINFLAEPIDFGKKFRGKRIFGDHKTWRGLIFGIIVAIAICWAQRLLYPHFAEYSLLDYQNINVNVLGFVLGFGALGGDIVKSFFKRQIGVAPGKTWIIFDQIDWIVGASFLMWVFFEFSPDIFSGWVYVVAIILFGLLHPIFNLISWVLGIQKNKF